MSNVRLYTQRRLFSDTAESVLGICDVCGATKGWVCGQYFDAAVGQARAFRLVHDAMHGEPPPQPGGPFPPTGPPQ